MGELPKRLLAWLAGLLPKQKIRGDDAIQVGRVDGDLHTDRSKHNHTTQVTQRGYVGTGAVHIDHVQNVTQVHQHFYGSAPMTPVVSPIAARPAVTAAQVLGLMDHLPEPVRWKVLDFMRREFGTALVVELQPHELYRTRRYVEAIGGQHPLNRSNT